jgi:hypothetical protein
MHDVPLRIHELPPVADESIQSMLGGPPDESKLI